MNFLLTSWEVRPTTQNGRRRNENFGFCFINKWRDNFQDVVDVTEKKTVKIGFVRVTKSKCCCPNFLFFFFLRVIQQLFKSDGFRINGKDFISFFEIFLGNTHNGKWRIFWAILHKKMSDICEKWWRTLNSDSRGSKNEVFILGNEKNVFFLFLRKFLSLIRVCVWDENLMMIKSKAKGGRSINSKWKSDRDIISNSIDSCKCGQKRWRDKYRKRNSKWLRRNNSVVIDFKKFGF